MRSSLTRFIGLRRLGLVILETVLLCAKNAIADVAGLIISGQECSWDNCLVCEMSVFARRRT
jgi:hypothetical protein